MDPWPGDVFEPHTLHRYLYGGDDPSNRKDPSGRYEFSVGGLVQVMAIGATLGASLGYVQGGPRLAVQRGLQFAAVAGAIYTLAGLIITVVASGGTIGSAATVTLPTLPFWQVISTRTIEIVQKLQQSFQGPPQAAYDALV